MKLRRLVVVLAALVLVAGACSSRGEDSSGSSDTGGGSTDTTAASGDATGVTFGDVESPCGEGSGDNAEPTGPPEETQGISADSIAVGTIADPGFTARPGLNQEIFDAGEAFVKWCNDQGGINGRELNLTQYDAAFTEYQTQMQEACGQEFAIVGDGAVQDNLWATTGVECDLIDVAGFSVTPEKAGHAGDDPVESRSVQPVPNPSDQYPVGGVQILKEENPEAFEHVGMLYGDFQTTITQFERGKEAYEALGADIVFEQAYNPAGEANWAPFATALKNADVQWLNFVGEGANLALLQQAMSEIDYSPEITLQDANFYDPEYLEAAGSVADGTFVRNSFVPFEEAADNKATQDYIDMVDAVGGKVALLGAQSVSGWLLFAQSAKECDDNGDLTRTCVLETAASVDDWTGDGLHAPGDPSTNSGTECVVLLQVQDGEFARYSPDEGFDCNPDYVVALEGDYSSG